MFRYSFLSLERVKKPVFHGLVAAILASIFAATWFVGIVPTRLHPYDVVFFADAGWRTLAGQRPHLDYFSPYGDGVQLLLAAGQWLAGGTIDGVGYISACVSLIVGVWAYLLLLRRSAPLPAVVGASMLALLCAAPVSLGYTFTVSSQAMFYNRFAFALLALLVVEAFPIPSGAEKPGAGGAFSTGVVCALLLFLKASYFLVAVMLGVGSFAWNPDWRARRLLAMAGGFLAGALPFLVYLRFRVDLFYADMQMAGAVRAGPMTLFTMASLFTQEILQLFILLSLGFLLGFEYNLGSWRRWRFAALALVIYGAGVLLMSTNAQPRRFPLNEMLALLFAGGFLQIAARSSARLQPAVAIALAIVALGIPSPDSASDAAALANGMRLKRSYNPAYAHNVAINGMKPFVMLDDYNSTASENTINTGAFLAPYLTDGVELLRQQLKPGELPATFDAYNPFPFLLRIPPPRGGMAAAAAHFLFDERHHPPEDNYFGNADVVMYPKRSGLNEEMSSGLQAVYGEALERRFVLAAESPWWKLYRRR